MAGRALRLLFFGTPDFAVPTLERLLHGPHPVAGVVSQPDRPAGRGRRLRPSPVSEVALREGLPLLRPERVGAPETLEVLTALEADLGVVVAFGQFLPRRVRELPALGYLVNGHASLLPRHRGAAPIAHAILAGDPRTGISVMRVEREMDAGPVVLVRETPIAPDETRGELEARLAAQCAEAIAKALERIVAGDVTWREQDASRATFAPKLGREDARLDWRENAVSLERRVRAMAPRPGAFTTWDGEPLRILAARAEPDEPEAEPGCVRRTPDGLRIATSAGWLVPLRLQRAGGRPLDVADFLRGQPIADGVRLGVQGAARVAP